MKVVGREEVTRGKEVDEDGRNLKCEMLKKRMNSGFVFQLTPLESMFSVPAL